ncbi:flagellar biosynthetic protein FliR [Cryptosporangium aurantiacum]|uniref:Flagellar biosynthetic protein FliR n=1 Tax=Cryptosporangium aurantiacum TaxID=134849 RepID=A0A1M7R7F3_9ACTN|nr:flagellar biosynthetic protein FliR [Cryptosporangium aurantiacum]SHN42072.1 flagellar biosynthetic protein FliR [Cryptosporangium aurantiacum]
MTWQFDGTVLVTVLLAMVRAAAWVTVSPPFASPLVSPRIRAILALAIALSVAPALRGQAPPMDWPAVVSSSAQQVVVGGALGFITALYFAAFQMAGDLIDMFGGFQVAMAYDPMAATQTAVFGRFYNLLATTLLFATGGHALVIRGFAASYDAVPLTGILSFAALGDALSTGLGHMFLAALQIAGPLIAVLFCADVALGLLTRVAPALNAFSLGFPAKILLTVLLAGIAIGILPSMVEEIVDRAVEAVMAVVRA